MIASIANTISPISEELSVQCCGSFDAASDEYSFTASSGGLCVTFEFLTRADIIEMRDCLESMLASDIEAMMESEE